MRTQAISDSEFSERYGWKPPKVVDRSEPQEGQHALPGLEDLHSHVPASGVKHGDPLYHEGGNPKVWGSLAGKGVHNPFLHHGLSEDHDIPDSWENHAGWNEKNNALADKVTKHLQKTVSAGHPCINLPNHALHQVLDEGRVKSQFETGTSRGALNVPSRAACEKANFGYKHPDSGPDYGYADDDDENDEHNHDEENKHPDHARPVYGFLAHDPVRNSTSTQYGEHTLVLKKPKVWHRTTTTMDDSLGDQDGMRASSVQDVKLHSADPKGYDWRNTSLPSAKDKPDFDEHENDLHHRLKHHLQHSLDERGDYTEAQYHGGVSTNDIHYAILRGSGGDDGHKAIKAHLNKAKVPWVHVGSGGSWTGPGKGTRVKDQSQVHEALFHRAVHYQVTLVAALEGDSMTGPKIIADRGAGVYLVDLGNKQGQIADTKAGIIYPPKHIDALLARGYWQECTNVDTADVLALVKPV